MSNHESVERKAAPYRDMTPAQRLEIVAAVCRTAGYLLETNPQRERVLQLVDLLPESSKRALARLRSELRAPSARKGEGDERVRKWDALVAEFGHTPS